MNLDETEFRTDKGIVCVFSQRDKPGEIYGIKLNTPGRCDTFDEYGKSHESDTPIELMRLSGRIIVDAIEADSKQNPAFKSYSDSDKEVARVALTRLHDVIAPSITIKN